MRPRIVEGLWAVCLVLATHVSEPARGATAPVDLPGAEIIRPEFDPELLEPLLPNFEAQTMELPSDADGMGPLRLSPTGRYCLAEQRVGRKQSVLLFDADGKLLRDLTGDRFSHATGTWGANDLQVLLECRVTPGARPVHLKINPVSGASSAGSIPGLPGWAPDGKHYLLGLSIDSPGEEPEPAWIQRYTSANDPIGRPMAVRGPVWSADGMWLAFGAQPPKPADDVEPTDYKMNEVRVLPTRGDVPRVVLSRGGWMKLARANGWLSGDGPQQLAWSPGGDALYGLFTVRTTAGPQKCLVRMDVRSPRREVLSLPAAAELVSASADARHWIVRLGDRLFRLDFVLDPPAPSRAPVPSGTKPKAPSAG
jgi:hypothetical protein